jgi:phosphatidylinositol glycan class V
LVDLLFKNSIHIESSHLLCAVFLNFIYFILTTVYLFKLTNILFNNNRLISLFTIIIYCINPANVFFNAAYSESLFSALTFSGLYYLYKYKNENDGINLLISLMLFFLSGLTRSNGLINFGYIGYVYLKIFFSKVKLKKNDANICNILSKSIDIWGVFNSLLHLIRIIISFVFIAGSFLLYQYYIYLKFCDLVDIKSKLPKQLIKYANQNNYKLINDLDLKQLEWCNKTLPFSYGDIQSKYWGVGFMSYWRIKQIPNFLLAAPILIISFYSLKSYFKSLSCSNFFNLLGLIDFNHDNSTFYKQFHKNQNLIPFAFHLIFLLISSIFFMHIQVGFILKLINILQHFNLI